MDVVITSVVQRSCLSNSSKSSDHAIRKVENETFRKDATSTGPIKFIATKRFLPLAMNHFGLQGGHFNALLKEFATLLVMRPKGCSLTSGPFALSMNGALRKILQSWGSKLAWITQRQHAAQIVSNMEIFFYISSFLSMLQPDNIAKDFPDPDPDLNPPPPPTSRHHDLPVNPTIVHLQI
jgi:hypothetical protein